MSKSQKGFSSLMVFIVIALLIGLGVYILNKTGFTGDFRGRAQSVQTQIYWGAYIQGSTYGINPATGQAYGNAPWDSATWDLFESHTGKKISILHWGEPWHWTNQLGYSGIGDGNFQKFYPGDFDKARNRGAIPLLDWGSFDLRTTPFVSQPNYSLNNIINGTYDSYITKWATDAKAWGHPFFLRFDSEMNGNWDPYSELTNGNSAGQFIQMWRHVHDIFTNVGATNVTWVWCPNISSTDTTTSIPMSNLYPGDTYVDWICLDGYNKDSTYKTFEQVFKGKDAATPVSYLNDSYKIITDLAPTKPLMIGETASNEYAAGQKAAWITDTLQSQIPLNFPRIKALLWFNWNSDAGSSYVIESSATSQAAFAEGISSNYYAANTFGSLPDFTKIQPPTTIVESPTPFPTITPSSTPIPTLSPSPSPAQSIPNVNITNPSDGMIVSRRSNITISAQVTSTSTVSKVEFYVNNTLICTDTSSPYSCSWNVPSKRNTTYKLTVKAYNSSNNFSSQTIKVTSNK